VDRMLEAQTEEEINSVMKTTSIGKHFLKVEHRYADEIPKHVKYLICHHAIHFSTHPSVVLMAYIFVTQAELIDIITIVEGVRYHLPPDEIAKLLVIYNYNKGKE
jgi:V/A-type H+-transporting ATPase subunit C